MKVKGLGRGLSALIGENLIGAENNNAEGLNYLSISNVIPNPNQPRKIFTSAELEELASSIKKNGVLQPIIVRSIGNEKYEIIAGERRWRASQIAGLITIPALIKDMAIKESLELALIENIQRENLSALEEAESYKKLIDLYNYTQEKISERVSKSRSHIANLLRLINLPEKVKNYMNQGLLSLGHAKLLINLEDAEQIADIIVNNNLNVRATEDLIRGKKNKKPINTENKALKNHQLQKDEDILALEENLSDSLGMQVKIDVYDKGDYKILINCENLEQLDLVVQKLTDSIS